jgi:alkanesulfonate monooxygenase SsuD/methylene tetrahydromethanopterin reductase-like flavin-dependent oxidoreductase (luciferase family)
MRFGLNISPSAAPGADPVADARRAEALGFDFVSVNDHLHGTNPTFETWTLLTWIAAATTRIGVASRVLGVPYRSPAVLAKMAESLDRLSGGRLTLGLGGGASNEEFGAFGLGQPTPGEKVAGLEEAIRIARGLWSEAGFTFEGRRYRVERAELEPKPAHRIPIWVGTYGPRMLELTGRLADGWIPSFGYAPPEAVPAMRDRIHAAADAAGRDPAEIALVYNVEVRVEDRPSGAHAEVRGGPGELAERLAAFAGLGFTGVNLFPVGERLDEQAERLAGEVLPAVRGETGVTVP